MPEREEEKKTVHNVSSSFQSDFELATGFVALQIVLSNILRFNMFVVKVGIAVSCL